MHETRGSAGFAIGDISRLQCLAGPWPFGCFGHGFIEDASASETALLRLRSEHPVDDRQQGLDRDRAHHRAHHRLACPDAVVANDRHRSTGDGGIECPPVSIFWMIASIVAASGSGGLPAGSATRETVPAALRSPTRKAHIFEALPSKLLLLKNILALPRRIALLRASNLQWSQWSDRTRAHTAYRREARTRDGSSVAPRQVARYDGIASGPTQAAGPVWRPASRPSRSSSSVVGMPTMLKRASASVLLST